MVNGLLQIKKKLSTFSLLSFVSLDEVLDSLHQTFEVLHQMTLHWVSLHLLFVSVFLLTSPFQALPWTWLHSSSSLCTPLSFSVGPPSLLSSALQAVAIKIINHISFFALLQIKKLNPWYNTTVHPHIVWHYNVGDTLSNEPQNANVYTNETFAKYCLNGLMWNVNILSLFNIWHFFHVECLPQVGATSHNGKK